MQWYLEDKERLELEIELMEDKGVNFQLFQDEEGNLLWRGSLSIMGHYHSDVRLVYPENFPYEPIKVYILNPMLPTSNLHIHEDGSICYMREEEWSPDWTAYAVYLKTIEFLYEFYSGKMDYSLPLPMTDETYSPRTERREKSILERLMEVFLW